jgi:lipopolysaccharide/colanic/teichoic acid biosynthesis glycosyltransferase
MTLEARIPQVDVSTPLDGLRIEKSSHIPLHAVAPRWGDRAAKRALDLLLAVTALVILSPVLLMVAMAVKLDSRGPVFFKQRRLGHGRRPFTVLKFRSMRVNVDDAIHREYVTEMLARGNADRGPTGMYKLEDDPRITRVGRVLRRTSLDELPQLINVIHGSMSLTGPRPALAWEASLFTPQEEIRFAVKPGITGLWQVKGRNRLTMKEALALDVEYVKTRSISRDCVILAATIPALLRYPGR